MKNLYIHRPCFLIALAFSVGIYLSMQWSGFLWAVSLLTGIFLCGGTLFRKPVLRAVCLCAVFIGLGYLHVRAIELLPPSHVAYLRFDERRDLVDVQGVIVSDVDTRQTLRGAKTSFELRVERLRSNGRWQVREGKVLVNVFRLENVRYGDCVLIKGKLHKPFSSPTLGHFSYEEYLRRNSVYWMLSVRKDSMIERLAVDQASSLQSVALKSRHYLQSVIEKYLNEIESGIIQSLVLGGRYHIPDSVRDVLVVTGTAHILAISGMNIGAVAFLFIVLLAIARVPRKVQLFLTVLFLAAYSYFTGANPSVVRATVMAIIFLSSFLVEREQESLNSLGIAAILILLWDPLSLLDIGFQLSFMGVFSIIYFYPRLYALWEVFVKQETNKYFNVFSQALCMSLAAWVGVAPLIAYYFQIVTPVTVLANLPIIPFVSALMMLGIGLIMASFLSAWLATAFASCIKVVLVAMMLIIDAFGRIPFGHWPFGDITLGEIVVYYIFVFGIFYCLARGLAQKSVNEHAQFFS